MIPAISDPIPLRTGLQPEGMQQVILILLGEIPAGSAFLRGTLGVSLWVRQTQQESAPGGF